MIVALAVSAHAWDRWGPTGDAALAAAMEDAGWDVDRTPIRFSGDDTTSAMIVVDVDRVWLSTEDRDALWAFASGGGHVFAVGADIGLTWPELGGTVGRVPDPWILGHREDFRHTRPDGHDLGWVGPGEATVWRDIVDGEDSTCTDLDPCLAPTDRDWVALLAQIPVGQGSFVVMPDARMLYNASFVDPGNTAWLAALRDWLDGDTTFVRDGAIVRLATSSVERPNPWQALARADMLPFVVQLLAFWTLLVLAAGTAMAPRTPAGAAATTGLAEHVRALARQQRRLDDTAWALASAARLHLARRGGDALVRAAIQRGRDPAEATAWRRRLEAIAASPEPISSPTDRADLEDLWNLI